MKEVTYKDIKNWEVIVNLEKREKHKCTQYLPYLMLTHYYLI